MSKKEKEKIAEAVAIGAIRYSIASVSPEKPIFFRWEDALSFERNSAPALQYTYARTSRILEKSRGRASSDLKTATPEEERLLLKLAKFPEVVLQAGTLLQPHMLAAYLNELNMCFKAFYSKCQVIGSDCQGPRLGMVKAT